MIFLDIFPEEKEDFLKFVVRSPKAIRKIVEETFKKDVDGYFLEMKISLLFGSEEIYAEKEKLLIKELTSFVNYLNASQQFRELKTLILDEMKMLVKEVCKGE